MQQPSHDASAQMRRVDFRTQVPESMLDHKDAQCTQQLRNDVATFFRGMGGMSSIWMLMLVLFPEAGKHTALHFQFWGFFQALLFSFNMCAPTTCCARAWLAACPRQ